MALDLDLRPLCIELPNVVPALLAENFLLFKPLTALDPNEAPAE